jgi:hypothetical protein
MFKFKSKAKCKFCGNPRLYCKCEFNVLNLKFNQLVSKIIVDINKPSILANSIIKECDNAVIRQCNWKKR